jgi:hypothetical protein
MFFFLSHLDKVLTLSYPSIEFAPWQTSSFLIPPMLIYCREQYLHVILQFQRQPKQTKKVVESDIQETSSFPSQMKSYVVFTKEENNVLHLFANNAF